METTNEIIENSTEIMENGEVTKTAEEIVKASSANGFKKAGVFGLVFITGYIAGKYVIDPVIARIKARKQKKSEVFEEVYDDDFYYEEEDESYEKEEKTE